MAGDLIPADGALAPDDTPSQPDTQAETNAGVVRATGILALGNVASRILGLVREIVIANLFGASAAVEAFNVAILIPRNLYDLLIGGHVNGAIIPVLSEVVTTKGKDELWRLVSVLISMLTAVLALLVLLLEIGAPLVVDVVAQGFDPYTRQLTVDLLRLTSPALIFMGLFAIASGTLYALRVFSWPAFATAMFNAAIVIIALLFTPSPRWLISWTDNSLTWEALRPDDGITVVAMGWMFGAIAYLVLQLPGLRGAKLRFTLNWRHPALRRIGLLYLPVMASLILDTLVVRLFSYNLASRSDIEGAIGIMNWATTLIQFPQGLVATAISIAILPTLARQAALITEEGDRQEHSGAFRETLGLGMRLAMTLILPAAVGLYVLATPIIALILEHGAFDAEATATTTTVLRLYLFGLPFAAIDLLLVYAFYARQDTLTPALIGVFSLSLYMVVAVVLFPQFGLLSLMIADSVKHLVHACISAYLLNRKVKQLGDRRFWLTTLKTAVAASVMGITAYGLLQITQPMFDGGGLINETLLVLATGGGSAIVFMLLVVVFKIEEWRWLTGIVTSKLI